MWLLVSLCLYFTSNGDRQRLAFSGNKGASTHLDTVQAVVVALIGALGTGKGESDGRGEGRKRLAHCAVGADQTQLEGAPWVLLQGGAGDVKTVAFDDGTSWGLRGCVEPVVGSQELHCIKIDKEEFNWVLYMYTWSKYSKTGTGSGGGSSPTVILMELLGGELSSCDGNPPLILY